MSEIDFLSREHIISYQEAQRNQREILNSSDFQAELKELHTSFNSTNPFQIATDQLNRQRGLHSPETTSTKQDPQPGPSNRCDIYDGETLRKIISSI